MAYETLCSVRWPIAGTFEVEHPEGSHRCDRHENHPVLDHRCRFCGLEWHSGFIHGAGIPRVGCRTHAGGAGVSIPLQACPEFDSCNVPLCPLDPALAGMERLAEDPSCPVSPGRRHAVWGRLLMGMQALLPDQGYTHTERLRRDSARRRWATLTPEERAEKVRRGAPGREALKKRREAASKAVHPLKGTMLPPSG